MPESIKVHIHIFSKLGKAQITECRHLEGKWLLTQHCHTVTHCNNITRQQLSANYVLANMSDLTLYDKPYY